MRLCELQCYLALLGLSLVLCGRSANSQLEPEMDFRHHRLLQRARAIGQAQEWTKKDVEELLSLLSMPEMQMRESDLSTTDENEDLRVELERSAESSNHIPARERKAGCKNFYWKGFTSC
ncbi:somatostatin 1.2 precursor [Danio rerio]|uniref:Somatostatin-2 n=1 Tax=Danio rerio TaxID=7955 RepID=E7FFY9_DANRE|nr:somatostatin 1.2 precursor [Danio rerio]XP_056329983.1 somatostatin 1.2 [Danio aesculapii]|eukprot:XP_694143.1 somatostatin-2 [Danio rerio]